MTQCEQILDFMERNGSITQMDALSCFGCARLASRICDLKKAGYNIEKETVKVRCRNGSFAYVAAYSFYKTKEEKIKDLQAKYEECKRKAKWYYHISEEDGCSNYEETWLDYEKEADEIEAKIKKLQEEG